MDATPPPSTRRWLGPAVAALVLGAGVPVYLRRLPAPTPKPVTAPVPEPTALRSPAPHAHPASKPAAAPVEAPRDQLPFDLVEGARAAGLVFTHQKPVFDKSLSNVMPWITAVGVSVAVADVDGDGRPDIFVTNMAPGSRNALFHNNGDGTFTDVTEQAGLAHANDKEGSTRALFFDWDNDGHPDLILAGTHCPKAFHNRGDGTFEDVTSRSGLTHCGVSWAFNAVDLDGDGNLDIVEADYFPPIDFMHPDRFTFMQDSLTDADNGGPIILYRNDGHGHFTPFPGNLGIKSRGWTHAVGVWDVDGDGTPDLYFATDYGNDQLYLNRGGGRFEDASASLENKYSRSGMNADFVDLDGDGRASVYVTEIYEPPFKLGGNMLWTWPKGGGRPVDLAKSLRIGECGWSWGAKFVDLDLDGRPDLVVTNGYISANPDKSYWYRMSVLSGASREVVADARNWLPLEDDSMSGYQHKCVFYNRGGRFEPVTDETGMRGDVSDGRGLAVIDTQSDGRLSLLEASQNGPLRYYRNVPRHHNAWVGFRLRGTRSNRDAWGAQVTVRRADGRVEHAELEPANSFSSQSDSRLVFGLGPGGRAASVEVRWPSGTVQRLAGPEPGRYHDVVEPR